MRPLIGISSYAETATWGAWGPVPAALLPLSYVQAVERAAGRPLLIPPTDVGTDETLDALDGLILSGGVDIDPAAYGHDPHPQTLQVRPERDRAELALLAGALARDLPVLGICRGMEILNVGCGGDLVQHLPDVVGHETHKVAPGVWSQHAVRLEPGSRIAGVLGGDECVTIHSHHHQGPGTLGTGLEVVARADDGTVEGLEDRTRSFVLGVLWHPEEGGDDRLFEALVAAARAYRARRNPVPHPD